MHTTLLLAFAVCDAGTLSTLTSSLLRFTHRIALLVRALNDGFHLDHSLLKYLFILWHQTAPTASRNLCNYGRETMTSYLCSTSVDQWRFSWDVTSPPGLRIRPMTSKWKHDVICWEPMPWLVCDDVPLSVPLVWRNTIDWTASCFGGLSSRGDINNFLHFHGHELCHPNTLKWIGTRQLVTALLLSPSWRVELFWVVSSELPTGCSVF